MTPPFRRATIADADELARLLSLLGHECSRDAVAAAWPRWDSDHDFALVADADEGLAGAVTLHIMHVLHRPKPVGRITALVIDPACRGERLGSRLTRAAEQLLAAAGCGMVEVTSHRRRTEAHGFYAAIGYEETSRRFKRRLDVPTA